ncbi:MAG: helix-turn-helix domain-containing protein [Candidatus Limnocylindrales bacterium]
MKPLVNRESRSYRSQLREEQADATRDRILEATLRVLTGGVAGVSIPAVAREAGVSIPTVYRIFGTKRALFEAIHPYSVRRANLPELKQPTSYPELRDGLRILFDHVDSLDDMARAAMGGAGADEIRHATMERRIAMTRQVTDGIAPGLGAIERERVARLLTVLTASASLRMWRDHLGVPVDEAIDEIEWILKAVVASSRSSGSS